MAETRPTGEQLRFVSAATGEHILDTYLEAAEKGGRTVPDILADIFDSTTGLFRADIFDFRVASDLKLQFRVGDFPDLVTGWQDVEGSPFLFFAPRGTWAPSTAYALTDLVRYNNATYYALTAHTSTSTFDPTKWSLILDDTELDAAIAAAAASASAAATSATNASNSATTATTQASNAANSASAASTSASNAATSASNASTSATNAANSASAASTSASNASTSATNAAASASAAASSYDSFDDRYLGPKTTNPTLDNDGNALLTGALYWNSTASEMRVYTGSAWVVFTGATNLDALSDVTITTPATGNLVRYNGTQWVNYPDSNYAQASHNHTLNSLSNVSIGTSFAIDFLGNNHITNGPLTSGDILRYDGSSWINVADTIYAASTHTHAISDVTNLQTTLDAKLDDSQASVFGLSLLDDADAAAARTTLGLGTGDSPTFTGLTLSGVGALSAGTALLPSLIPTGDTNTGMWFPAADTVAWSTGGTERTRIDSSGRLLLGTDTAIATGIQGVANTPSFQFHGILVSPSSAGFYNWNTSASTSSVFTFNKSVGGAVGTRGGLTASGTSYGSIVFNGDNGTTFSTAAIISALADAAPSATSMPGRIVFFTTPSGSLTATERMRIRASGDVGIGTTAPDALLSVNGIASFGAGAVTTPSIAAFGDLNTGMWFPAADTIAWSTGGSERMRIDSSGNVGIGTNAPTYRLDVQSSSDSFFRVKTTGTASAWFIGEAGAAGAVYYHNPSNTPSIITTNNSERARITATGNVGVGTSSPDALLSVNGVASFGAGAAATPSIAGFGDLNTGMWFPAADTIAFSTGGSERMRIAADGTVTIGGVRAATVNDVNQVVENAQTGTSYTLALTDAGKMVTLSNASAITLTIPTNASVAFPVDTRIDLLQYGAGQVTVGGAGVTIRSSGSKLKLAGQYSGATLWKKDTDEWVLIGDIVA